jgi:hypothetical protein
MTRETVAAGMLSVHRSKQTSLTLIRIAIRKCVTVRLGVWESNMTPRQPIGSREDSLLNSPPPPCAPIGCLGVVYCMTPSRLEYRKTPLPPAGSFYFLIGKLPKTTFFYIKTFNKIKF